MSTSTEAVMWSSAALTTSCTSTSTSSTSDSESSGPFSPGLSGPFSPGPSSSRLSSEEFLKQGNHLRDEIRCSIIQKRIQKGLDNIRLGWKPNGSDSMNKEDEDKRKQRRERNRVAASRCRERRRERTFVLVEETDELESSKQEIIEEIGQLEEQKAQLMAILSEHNHSGQCQMHLHDDQLHIDP